MPPTLESLPPEILVSVLKNVQPLDFLAVKLTSKTILAHTVTASGTEILDNSLMCPHKLVQSHLRFEKYAPNYKKLQHLVCTGCGKVKPKEEYTNNQRKFNTRRFCIACGVIDNDYVGRNIRIGGNDCFACKACKKAKPLDEEFKREKNTAESPCRYVRHYCKAQPKARFCIVCVELFNADIDIKQHYDKVRQTLTGSACIDEMIRFIETDLLYTRVEPRHESPILDRHAFRPSTGYWNFPFDYDSDEEHERLEHRKFMMDWDRLGEIHAPPRPQGSSLLVAPAVSGNVNVSAANGDSSIHG